MTILWIVLVVLVLLGAALIYPGELSQVSSGSNRWLYDRAARGYEDKWRSRAYEDETCHRAIERHARASLESSGVSRVLDLGCGTGRGIRVANRALPEDTRYVGIDFSPRMLEQLRASIEKEDPTLERRLDLVEEDLTAWAGQERAERFGLVLLLEVGEFVPGFAEVVKRVAQVTAPGGGLVLTRPARLWSLFFPGRHQTRSALRKLLVSLGFEDPEFLPWRSRYELVFTRRIAR